MLGIVARNDGDIIEVHASKVNVTDPMVAELLAVKEAIQISLKNGWRNILCESDARVVVQCLNGGSLKNLYWKLEPILK